MRIRIYKFSEGISESLLFAGIGGGVLMLKKQSEYPSRGDKDRDDLSTEAYALGVGSSLLCV